jgi:hypothetical protein
MVQLIKSPKAIVTKEIVEIKDGKCEVTIKLDLNINIDGASVARSVIEEKKEETEVPLYTIPNFQLQKIKFGEKVN